MRFILDLLTTLLVVVLLVLVGVVAAGLLAAAFFLVGRTVGGLFGVATLEATAVVVAIAAAVGLGLVLALRRPSPPYSLLRPDEEEDDEEDLVPAGTEEPLALEYDSAGDPHCPNCDQRLALPRRRPDHRPRV